MKEKNRIFSNLEWISFIAKRYVSKQGNRSSSSSTLAILGIAIGVLSLVIIISVMNGFQLGFIESIIEVSSYHARISNFPITNEALLSKIKNIHGVEAAVFFTELKGVLTTEEENDETKSFLLSGERQSAVIIRGIQPDVMTEDYGMAKQLDFESGSFNLESRGNILLGSELAAVLGLGLGDVCEFISVSNFLPHEDDGQQALFTVQGIFRTGFYEYDLAWAFVSLEDAFAFEKNGRPYDVEEAESPPPESFEGCMLGIKLKNRDMDRPMVQHINEVMKSELGADYMQINNIQVNSWRNYNKAFFNALRTEKLMMFFLVGLIFIITAMNIYHSQRRSVLERSEEIALLRATGASSFNIRLIFAFNGFILGFLGSTIGMLPALLIATHIHGFFSGIEAIVNFIINGLSYISGGLFGEEGYYIFSPAVFYLKEIPSRVIPGEVVLIYMFGFLSAVAAAFIASGRVSCIRPAEVLRYE